MPTAHTIRVLVLGGKQKSGTIDEKKKKKSCAVLKRVVYLSGNYHKLGNLSRDPS